MDINMKIEFNIMKIENLNEEDIINKPITNEDRTKVIGIINDVVLSDSGEYYVCKGYVWDKFVLPKFFITNKLCSVSIE
jgi:hypothetical protein